VIAAEEDLDLVGDRDKGADGDRGRVAPMRMDARGAVALRSDAHHPLAT
jgi:hypothetical protein